MNRPDVSHFDGMKTPFMLPHSCFQNRYYSEIRIGYLRQGVPNSQFGIPDAKLLISNNV